MTCKKDSTVFEMVMKQLMTEGFGGMRTVMTTLYNEMMKVERVSHLKAEPYERTNERTGYANGFKGKTVKTTLGALSLLIPQTRDTEFYPSSLSKGLQSEQALLLSMAEMYLKGVSTRKVTTIMETMCGGMKIDAMAVSRATQSLDASFAAWRNRPLGEMRYVFFDATYLKARHGEHVRDCAILTAIGVTPKGQRMVLGCQTALSEDKDHWGTFFESLKARGLHGMKLITSDDHAGLKAARKAAFSTTLWQRCQFHLLQNAQSYVPKKNMKTQVTAEIRDIFNAPSHDAAKERLDQFITRYTSSAPALATWAELALPQGLVVFVCPKDHRVKVRTSNMIERVNKEIKRRTRVSELFPNSDACLRLVSGILKETSDQWEAKGRIYLTI